MISRRGRVELKVEENVMKVLCVPLLTTLGLILHYPTTLIILPLVFRLVGDCLTFTDLNLAFHSREGDQKHTSKHTTHSHVMAE